MSRLRNRLLIAVALAVFAVAPLSGCGKKGDPKPPRKDTSFPKAYPSGAPRSNAAPNKLSKSHQLAFRTERSQ